MNILVSKVPRTLMAYFGERTYVEALGLLVTPRSRTLQIEEIIALGGVWAADNDCFQALDKPAYLSMLRQIAPFAGACKFVAAPDVPYDARATLLRFDLWRPVLRHYGLPVALVAQDGLESCIFNWGEIDALFVGGSDAWKLGDAARLLMQEAKALGKWIHVGRVNTRTRLRAVFWRDADSIDGTSYARWSQTNLPAAIRELRYQHSRRYDNLPLWDGEEACLS